MTRLDEIARYTDGFLRLAECGDWSNALNGVQVENSGKVTKIGAAVDASARTFSAAAESGVDLLIVHHGLFWPGVQPITGAFRRQLSSLLEQDIALYSAHLPLDVHPLVGNNAQLATSLGLDNSEPFLEMKGQLAGVKSRTQILRDELTRRLEQSLGGAVKLVGSGPALTQTVAVVTGNGGPEIYNIAREGIDTFITGEAPHWAAVAAEELGVNLFIGGHYATETFGVKALAAHLSERFAIPWEFIAAPTGL
ncbi:MAG TPA: Nif3-like dinuclear metal center hexameric protein [Chthoniobacterales bacterium]|nr:Nif3-like dinuclear metal center hexameric protein [Chthoniobacterales bacterium]